MPSTPARRGRAWVAAALLAAVSALAAGAPACGQVVIRDDEDLDFERPEAWGMKYFTSTSLLTGFGVPEAMEPGTVEVGLELGWIPELDEDERRVGFTGTKVEDVNKAPLLARLRGTVGLPGGFSATLGYTPPVEVFDGVEAHLVAGSLNRPLAVGGRWRLGGRLFGQWGLIESDITCPGDVARVEDPSVNPFRCESPSADEMTMRYLGAELSAARDAGGAWLPHAAVAAQHLDMEFQVDARYAGLVDRTRLTADGWTWSATVGVSRRYAGGTRLAAEVFYSPLEVDRDGDGDAGTDPLLNVRVLLTYPLR